VRHGRPSEKTGYCVEWIDKDVDLPSLRPVPERNTIIIIIMHFI